MTSSRRLSGPTFLLELPEGFEAYPDEQGFQCVCLEPPGVLHLTPEEVEDPTTLPSLSRMLAGFLTRSGHPVTTQELLRITSVPEAHGFSWQYVEQEKYHRLWLFGNQRSWMLITFVCPEEARPHFEEPLSTCLKSLRLRKDEHS